MQFGNKVTNSSHQKLNEVISEWGKIFANHVSDKGLLSKIYKELI